MTRADDDSARDVVRFLADYADDAAAAGVRPLAEYIARYPSSAEEVAREFLGLREDREPLPAAPGLDRFRIVEEIARGGQGHVHLAEDLRLGRLVALKTLPRAGWSRASSERFRREAKAASRLNHPAICAVHDSGEAGEVAWIAMQYVPGETLARRIERGDPLPIPALLAYFEAAARALHAAHQAGVVHRDVKPSNLMVTPELQPVILDFGLASLGSDDATITRSGELMGTPAYMAPELLTGGLERAGVAADVWSLAVTLFEALTQRRPFDAPTREAMFDAIRTQPLPDPRRFNAELPRELKTVLAVATDKDPDRRYASALAFAEDLRRVRCREPILARPPGAWYRLRRWTERHPLVSTLLVLLVVAAGIAIDQARRAVDATALAQRGERSARREAYFARIGGAAAAIEANNPAHAASLLAESPAELRGFEHAYLTAKLARGIARLTAGAPLRAAVFEGGGSLLLADAAGEVARWDPRTLARTPLAPIGEPVTGPAAFSAGGRRLVAAVGAGATELLWFDVAARRSIARLRPGVGAIERVAIDAAGAQAVAGGRQHAVHCVADPAVAPRTVLRGPIGDLSFSRDGRALAVSWNPPNTGPGEGWMAIFDAATLRRSRSVNFNTRRIGAIDAGDDGSVVASGSADKLVRLHDPAERRLLHKLGGHIDAVECVVTEPGQRRLASAALDRTVRVWDAGSGALLALLTGAAAPIEQLAFAPDGELLLGRSGHELMLWRIAGPAGGELRGHERFVYATAFAEDGRRILSGSWDESVRWWDAATETCFATLDTKRCGIVLALSVAASARCFATAHNLGVRIWDLDTGRPIAALLDAPAERVNAVWLAPDASSVIARTVSHVACHALPGGELQWRVECRAVHDFNAIAVSPDRQWLAADGPGRLATIWRIGEAEPRAKLRSSQAVSALEFTPDGRLLAVGCVDGTVGIWRVGDWSRVWEARLHAGAVYVLRCTPDGTRLASGSEDTTALLTDVETGQPGLLLQGHAEYVFALAFAPDGQTLLSGSGDGTVRVWHATPGHQRGERAARMRVANDRAAELLGEWGEAAPAELAARVRADPALDADLKEALLQRILARALR